MILREVAVVYQLVKAIDIESIICRGSDLTCGHSVAILIRSHEIRSALNIFSSEVRGVIDGSGTGFTFFSGYQYYTAVGLCTIDSSGGTVFQNVDRLDVVLLQQIEVTT